MSVKNENGLGLLIVKDMAPMTNVVTKMLLFSIEPIGAFFISIIGAMKSSIDQLLVFNILQGLISTVSQSS